MKYLIGVLFATMLTACNLLSPATLLGNEGEVPSVTIPTSVAIEATPTNTVVVVPTATQIPPTVAPVVACTPRADWFIYTVLPGDTLGRIAQRTGSTINDLAIANCLLDINVISVGQQLRVPVLPPPVTPELVRVGEVAGMPAPQACWASNPGTNPPVYAAPDINAAPFGFLVNRVFVAATDSVGWLTVSDSARADYLYMKSDTVNFLGNCASVLGIPVDQYWHYYGNQGAIPTNVCAVSPVGQSAFVYRQPLPGAPATEQIGILVGWMTKVSIHNAGYFEVTDGTYTVWVLTTDVVESPGCVAKPLPTFGNQGAIPTDICAVSPNGINAIIVDQPTIGGPYDVQQVGLLTGWMRRGTVHNAGFYEITDDAHAIGWVEAALVTESAGCFVTDPGLPVHMDPGSPPTTVCNVVHPGGTAQIIIRLGAGEQFAPIAMLGNWAEIIGQEGDWYHILLGPGSTGWVNGNLPGNSPNLVGAC